MRACAWFIGCLAAASVVASIHGATTKPSTRPVESTWNKPDTENVKSTNGFGAQLWLADRKFLEEWAKPADPHLTPLSVVKRGVPFYAIILFAEPAADEKGLAHVTYDLRVRRPDGSIYGEAKNLEGSQDLRPRPRAIEPGRSRMGIRIKSGDPAGEYVVEATVRDEVRRVALELRASFKVDQ